MRDLTRDKKPTYSKDEILKIFSHFWQSMVMEVEKIPTLTIAATRV